MERRYMLFVYNDYYPAGGMDDCKLITDDYSELEKEVNRIKKEKFFDVIQIYDIKEDCLEEIRLEEVLQHNKIVKSYIKTTKGD
mgnify:CR=1 FL=1